MLCEIAEERTKCTEHIECDTRPVGERSPITMWESGSSPIQILSCNNDEYRL